MKDKILDILENYQVNEENQAGVKGNVIWDTDFEFIANKLVKLFAIPDVRLSLPDKEQLISDADDYVDKLNLPQNDSQDWQEYEQAKMKYVLDLIYNKGNETLQ